MEVTMKKSLFHAAVAMFFATIITACGGGGGGDSSSGGASFGFNDISLTENITLPIGSTYTYDVSATEAGRALAGDIRLESVSGVYTSVNGFTVTALNAGNDIIKATYTPTGETRNLFVKVENIDIQSLSATTSQASTPAGSDIIISLSGTTTQGNIEQNAIKVANWSGDLNVKWNESHQSFVAVGYEAGTYRLTASLGGVSTSLDITITTSVPEKIEWNTATTTNISVNSEYYGIIQVTYTDLSVIVNDTGASCSSSDTDIATISESPDEDGFLIKTYAPGTVTFSCSINDLPLATRSYSIYDSIQTSWRSDSTHNASSNCSSSKCVAAHIHKSENGSLTAIIESPGDTFRIFNTSSNGESLSYSASVPQPDNMIDNTLSQTTPAYSFGRRGIFSLNYEQFNPETMRNEVQSQTYLLSQLSPTSSPSAIRYSTPTPTGALLLSNNLVALGNGVIEQVNTDDNGGAPSDSEDANLYVPDYRSRLLLNGDINRTVRNTLNDNSTTYNNLVNTIKSSLDFGTTTNSYFTFSSGNTGINQNFLFDLNGSGLTQANRSFSVCNLTSQNITSRLFIKQYTYPKNQTAILCVNDTDAYLWIYDDNSSDSSVTVYSTQLPSDWISPESMEGHTFIGVDTPSDVFGASGDPSIATYFGYSGTDAVKTHYAIVLEDGTLKAITPEAKIGMDGSPYLTSDLMSIPDSALFNYVTTSDTKELWTPYGTLGRRSDRENWSMNMGYAPFTEGAFIPFTYARNGKKSQGLFVFTRGDADAVQYGSMNIYYSDLFNLK